MSNAKKGWGGINNEETENNTAMSSLVLGPVTVSIKVSDYRLLLRIIEERN